MGQIIHPSGVRNFFPGFLPSSVISQESLNLKIEAVEKYVSTVYYNGSYPSKGRIPCILLTAASVIRDPALTSDERYGDIQRILDITFQPARGGRANETLADIWTQQAHSILRTQVTHMWKLYMAYD